MRTAVWLAQDVVRALGGEENYDVALSSAVSLSSASAASPSAVAAARSRDAAAAASAATTQRQQQQPRQQQPRQQQRRQQQQHPTCVSMHVETYTVKSVDTVWRTTAAEEEEYLHEEDIYEVGMKERFISGIAISITRPPPPPLLLPSSS